MATSNSNSRTPEQVRREIAAERDEVVGPVGEPRSEIGEATNIAARLRPRLPVIAAGTLGAGFVLAGGIGATMRLLARRGREGHSKARFGRFTLVERD